MTDNDIIKALKNIKYRTDGIVTRGYYFDPETFELFVDLVNRQKAEIERLQGEVGMYEEERKYHFEMSRQRIAEAIKEFADRLKELMKYETVIYDCHIDNLVKEIMN